MTKSAFTQARSKLSSCAFPLINKHLLSYFENNHQNIKTWKGLRPVAIDGSQLNLPSAAVLATFFGTRKNQRQMDAPFARCSIAFDICNRLVLDAIIAPFSKGEMTLAKLHFPNLNPQHHVLVFDRGYASIAIALALSKQGFHFCFRLSSTWKEAYKLLEKTNDLTWFLQKGRRYEEYGKEKSTKEDLTLRLIKVAIPGGFEILLTNMMASEGFTIADLRELYKMRWQVEECYKQIKQVGQVEFFSGRTVASIEQDFYARIVMLNLCSLIETQAWEPREQERSNKLLKSAKHKKQINRTQVYALLKTYLPQLLLKSINNIIPKLLKQLYPCYDIVRPDRSFERNTSFRCRQKMLQYKAA